MLKKSKLKKSKKKRVKEIVKFLNQLIEENEACLKEHKRHN